MHEEGAIVFGATSIENKMSLIKTIRLYSYFFIKRVFDLVCVLFGFIFLIPIILFVKLAYMFNKDFDRVIFTQKRIGKNGKEFKFFKFRTMVKDADEVLVKLLAENKELKEEYDLNKKLKHDPRITKVGRVLRKTSLDELPQIINVFLGQMSIIGNRPYLPREKEDMGYYFDEIVKTKPGLTGYWQVSGRSNTTFMERLKLEKYYSQHCGLKMDIKIFFKTFIVVLSKKGAR